MSLPFLILEPFKEKRHGSCRWFLARSDNGETLMIVRTYQTCCFAKYNHSHCKVFEQDPSFSGPSGIFDWRLVSSLDTRSLFVGLNYPINQEITTARIMMAARFRSSGKIVCTQCTMRLCMHHTFICAATLCSPK